MATPKTYTERISVRIPVEQREEMDAQLGDVGLSAAIRNATLGTIGREDLVIDDQRDEGGHKRRKKMSGSLWAVIPVPLTTQQKRAIEGAAQAKGVASSKLMLDAIRFDLGLAASEGERGWRKGWKVGRRKSDAPTFTGAQKKKILADVAKLGITAGSRKHDLSRSTVNGWRQAAAVRKPAKKKK